VNARARRTEGRLAALTWIIMVLGVSTDLVITGPTNQPNRIAVSVFCAVFFGVLVVRLCLAMRARRRDRLTIGVLTIGAVLWATESTVLQSAQSSGHGQRLATGEWAYLLTYLVFVVYLLLDAEHRPATRLSTWLETVVICAGSASLAGMLLLTPLTSGRPEDVSILVAVVYPVADGVLALLVVAQLGLRMRAPNRKSAQLCLGFLLLAAADTSFVGNVLHGSSGSTVIAIVLWGAGFAELTAAACRHAPQVAIASTSELPGVVLGAATLAAVAVLVIRPDDQLGTYLCAAAVMTLLAAGVRMMLAVHEARRANQELAIAGTDQLTGLPNRRGVLARVDADRRAGHPLALMIMDLNGFKDINDALGHSVGDLILQLCGRRLRQALPPSVMVARLGGDEFALVFADEDEIDLLEHANTALTAIREPAVAHGIELVLDASVGIAIRQDDDRDNSALLRRADVAMYQAKQLGVGSLIYDAARDDFSRDRLLMVEELRRGIDEGQLVLWYQPQIDAATQRIRGVEALVRWQHPRKGILPPVAFLPAARHAGLMPALSEAVIRLAAADMRSWRDVELGFPVSLNCPPPELLSGVFVRTLLSVVAETGLRPSDFVIEVTEESFIADPERARDIVATVRGQGLQISVDDYGVGFSSLAYLRDLPIDELKLDRSFLFSMADDARSAALVESTVALAHSMDLRMVAEGVESRAAYLELARYGCDEAQGHYVLRPVPAAVLDHWLIERASPEALIHLVEPQAGAGQPVTRRSHSNRAQDPDRP
jgi:diguanylate cyclase (GGDEF)-like protein